MEGTSNPSNVLGQLRPLTKIIEATFTRPPDTTAYADGDAVCNSTSAPTIMTFSGVARAGGLGAVLQSAVLIMSTAAATAGDFDLLVFDTSVGMSNDNAAFTPSDSDAEKAVAVIQFRGTTNGSKLGANIVYDAGAISRSVKCAAGSTSLYGVLVARSAYVPGNAEVFRVRLGVIQD